LTSRVSPDVCITFEQFVSLENPRLLETPAYFARAVASLHQVIASKALVPEQRKLSQQKTTYGTIANLPQISCPFVDEEGLVIHGPNLYSFTSGWNLRVRSDIGCSAGATDFSYSRNPATHASGTATIF